MQTPEQHFGSQILPKIVILNQVQMKILRITTTLWYFPRKYDFYDLRTSDENFNFSKAANAITKPYF